MPYDLYGQYYASSRDAENAEMAQCAEIDARAAYKKVADLERQLQQQQNPLEEIWQYCRSMEERIKLLEAKTHHNE